MLWHGVCITYIVLNDLERETTMSAILSLVLMVVVCVWAGCSLAWAQDRAEEENEN